MKCPQCHMVQSKVIESRDVADGDSIRRRRECLDCQYRYTTYERIERPNLAVIKKNGARELFDRYKLLRAIHRSVGKFFISELEIETIVAQVEDALYGKGVQEVKSSEVGDLVLEQLAKHNKVAYVRFASVYKEFRDLDEFEAVLKQLRRL
ncbi:MAG TPA: transcriptional regulator NrdR [Candidatus Saccharimonadales bacterium]